MAMLPEGQQPSVSISMSVSHYETVVVVPDDDTTLSRLSVLFIAPYATLWTSCPRCCLALTTVAAEEVFTSC